MPVTITLCLTTQVPVNENRYVTKRQFPLTVLPFSANSTYCLFNLLYMIRTLFHKDNKNNIFVQPFIVYEVLCVKIDHLT